MKKIFAHSLVDPAVVAAVGFAVSDIESNARVTIVRRRDGSWFVIELWAREGWDAQCRAEAVSIAAAVICGANLVGILVSDLVVGADVRWVGVHRSRRNNRSLDSRRS
ncbi:MAG: hypothetical protein HIU84_07920 [Acidobacteria bacterium]|nr:hypothetical protein [Acidobacteriota bacterium]